MSAIWIEIIGTKGSTPRDVGTAMKVTPRNTTGTIGGGALEHRAIAQARQMIARDETQATRSFPLGPGLGQCCGGSVTLQFSTTPATVDCEQALVAIPEHSGPRRPLWLWGAGHVGRAMVRALVPTGAFDITWIDDTAARFPDKAPADVTVTPATDMPRLATHAPRTADHLIFTYSHAIDLALCAALLRRGFGSCGLIGSATKWVRFQKRLRAMGLDPAPITCPIGDPGQGKHPDAIARTTAAALLRERMPA